MRTLLALVSVVVLLSSALFIGRNKAFSDSGLDAAAISLDSGIQGSVQQGVFKVEFKRNDLETAVDGIKLTPEFGLTAWISLSGTRNHALLLGDLPLRQEEVGPILRVILEQGLSATSLHNRFTMDSSRVMSLHFEGLGTEESLAPAMGKVYAAVKELKPVLEKNKRVNLDIAHSKLDQKVMEGLLWKGEMSKGIFKVELARGTTLMDQKLGELAGASSWAAFAGNEQAAVVNGDIATLEDELPAVLKDLIAADIQITSIHTHMTQEMPKLIFVHFFGTGKVEALAPAVKEAIWEKEHFQSQ